MLEKTKFTVDINLIDKSLENFSSDTFRTAINKPTGNFFYDPWEIKEEFFNTSWHKMISVLPKDSIGEARIIILKPNTCYQTHADIDDRYHLNLTGYKSYLINLETDELYELVKDGIWYDMDAGKIHTAANFGYEDRIQLVVRKLLKKNILKNPKRVKIVTELKNLEMARFLFDAHISPFLNKTNKEGIFSNFSYEDHAVNFDFEDERLVDIEKILPNEFQLRAV